MTSPSFKTNIAGLIALPVLVMLAESSGRFVLGAVEAEVDGGGASWVKVMSPLPDVIRTLLILGMASFPSFLYLS
jgi:hypothetical protein